MNVSRICSAVASLALLWVGSSSPAAADGPAPRLVVSYVEAQAGQAGAVAARLKAYAEDARRSPGAPQVILLKEVGRPNRLLVVEQWRDLTLAADNQMLAALTAKMGDALQAPIDHRFGDPITPPIAERGPATALHIVMHVDVVPEGSDEGAKMLQAQAQAALAAPGCLGFEVAVQDNRHNHFAVHEVWKTRAAYEAYAATPAAQDFRRSLQPIKGALFDDQMYTLVGPAR